MATFRNQIVGLIRFSLVTTGDFYKAYKTPEDLAAMLFDPARLARRFALFEAICLPSLVRQHDQDFTCLFLTGSGMPGDWAQRLADLLAPHRWARIVPMPPQLHYPAISKTFATLSEDGFTHRTTFRLDDDDAIDMAHVGRLRQLAEDLYKVAAGPIALGFNRGLYMQLGAEGNEIFDARERTPLSVGAALLAPAGHADNIYRHNHRALPQYYNTWSDAENFVYLRTLHQDNKSNPYLSGDRDELDRQGVEQVLREKFGFRPRLLRSLKL